MLFGPEWAKCHTGPSYENSDTVMLKVRTVARHCCYVTSVMFYCFECHKQNALHLSCMLFLSGKNLKT